MAPGKSFWIASQNGRPPTCRSLSAGQLRSKSGTANFWVTHSNGSASVL